VGHDPDVAERARAGSCAFVLAVAITTIVREGLVCLRHPVDVVLRLHGAALLFSASEDLAGELVAMASRAARAST
jgi:hypothetical protein